MVFPAISQDISSIKQAYRERFGQAHQLLLERYGPWLKEVECLQCQTPPEDIATPLHDGCTYREWQQRVLSDLKDTMGQAIVESLADITDQREKLGSCHMCGACCRMASSEFTYDQLLQRAKDGDWFSQQFTSVFLPYENLEAAKAAFPAIVDEMMEQTDGEVFFYHCPHVTAENKCGLYGDPRRPELCAQYPDSPLTLMHQQCGYQPWRIRMLPQMLETHALLQLSQFYVGKLEEVLAPKA